jgi:hypothetical protein
VRAAGREHGEGVQTYADGSVYEGQWADGKPHGAGGLTRPNGVEDTDGPGERGEMRRALETVPDGSSYDGEFENDRRHGRGVWTLPDGGTYVVCDCVAGGTSC